MYSTSGKTFDETLFIVRQQKKVFADCMITSKIEAGATFS